MTCIDPHWHHGQSQRRYEEEQQRERDQRHPGPGDDVLRRPGGGDRVGAPGYNGGAQALEAEIQLPTAEKATDSGGGECCAYDDDVWDKFLPDIEWIEFE